MNVPDALLMRAYGTDKVFFEKTSAPFPLTTRLGLGLLGTGYLMAQGAAIKEQTLQARRMNEMLAALQLAKMHEESDPLRHTRVPVFAPSDLPPGFDEGMVRMASALLGLEKNALVGVGGMGKALSGMLGKLKTPGSVARAPGAVSKSIAGLGSTAGVATSAPMPKPMGFKADPGGLFSTAKPVSRPGGILTSAPAHAPAQLPAAPPGAQPRAALTPPPTRSTQGSQRPRVLPAPTPPPPGAVAQAPSAGSVATPAAAGGAGGGAGGDGGDGGGKSLGDWAKGVWEQSGIGKHPVRTALGLGGLAVGAAGLVKGTKYVAGKLSEEPSQAAYGGYGAKVPAGVNQYGYPQMGTPFMG